MAGDRLVSHELAAVKATVGQEPVTGLANVGAEACTRWQNRQK